MNVNIQKVTHYEINLNLSEIEFNVFRAILSNLKEEEVLNAFSNKNTNITSTTEKVLKAYDNLKRFEQTSIKVGSE